VAANRSPGALRPSSPQGVRRLLVAPPAHFGVPRDRPEPVVAEELRGEARVAQLLLDDRPGRTPEPMGMELGYAMATPSRAHTSSAPRTVSRCRRRRLLSRGTGEGTARAVGDHRAAPDIALARTMTRSRFQSGRSSWSASEIRHPIDTKHAPQMINSKGWLWRKQTPRR
jgi:hypothetical protein